MAIKVNIEDEKGVVTGFHRISSYMVNVDTNEIIVAVSSYISDKTFKKECSNKEKAKLWEESSKKIAILSEQLQGLTDSDPSYAELKAQYDEASSHITGAVSTASLAYSISEYQLSGVKNPTIQSLEKAILKLDTFKEGEIV